MTPPPVRCIFPLHMENSYFDSFIAMLDTLGALGIVGTIVIGLMAGIVAKILMPGRDPGGLIVTAAIGVAGSYFATYLGDRLGITIAGSLSGFVAAVVGAFLILLVYRLIFRRREQ